MIDVGAAIRAGIASLVAADIEYVVVGSVAASAWGVLRSTRDVDLVVAVAPEQLLRWLESVDSTEFYVADDFAREVIQSGGSFNMIHLEGGAKIDIFVPSADDPLASAALARRVRADVFGSSCWVASAEDLILAKLKWRLESRSERQWIDCGEIAATVELDRAYLRSRALELGLDVDLAQLITEVDGLA